MKNIDFSIEYAHIYSNQRFGDEQKLSLDILSKVKSEFKDKNISLVVMVDDYSFPDPSFNYTDFLKWLKSQGYLPDAVLRESQLIPICDNLFTKIQNTNLREELYNYIKSKKYPCSLFIATWYLIRLGYLESNFFRKELIAKYLINILPISFKPFEDKAMEIIKSTNFMDAAEKIENRYFEGRTINI